MDAVEDIKNRLSIEDVVSQYIELKRAGRNYKALSPFSQEKTPSFVVSPEKQIWHDFSSGRGGDMFSFVMETEGLDFKGALELLARQAGVDLSQYKGPGRAGGATAAKQKERLYAALDLAAKFYQAHFAKNKLAQDYIIKQRHFNKQSVVDFRLGYSPSSGSSLTTFLLGKGFSAAELKKAGLATNRSGRGLGDLFRGRIMIPLMDSTGRVIGFTARQLVQEGAQSPKYINTPSTPLYDKSRHVFGLHLAKEAIRKSQFVVIAEGNLDVIASHQADVRQCVATAGTALTAAQLKALSRFTDDIRLAFDQDKAGLAAAERAIPIAAACGVSLGIITVPAGKDPDELIRQDPAAWQKTIEQPQYVVDWLMDRYAGLLDITSAQGKRAYTDKLLSVVGQLEDSVERDHYLQKIAKTLGVGMDALRDKTRTLKKQSGQTVRKRPIKQSAFESSQQNTASRDQIKNQNNLLALGLILPSLREYLYVVTPQMLPDQQAKKLLNFLKAQPDFNYDNQNQAAPLLPELAQYGRVLALLFEELYQHLEVSELRHEAARLQMRVIETYVKAQKRLLAEQMQAASEAGLENLLEKAKELDVLLKNI